MSNNKIKTFPLTVTEDWLDKIEEVREKHESKHAFILRAVEERVKFIKSGNEIIYEEDEK